MSKEVQKQEREREKITGADTKECNLNSEMTEQVKICSVVTTMLPTAENLRERQRQRQTERDRERENANVKQILSHPLYYLSSE